MIYHVIYIAISILIIDVLYKFSWCFMTSTMHAEAKLSEPCVTSRVEFMTESFVRQIFSHMTIKMQKLL